MDIQPWLALILYSLVVLFCAFLLSVFHGLDKVHKNYKDRQFENVMYAVFWPFLLVVLAFAGILYTIHGAIFLGERVRANLKNRENKS